MSILTVYELLRGFIEYHPALSFFAEVFYDLRSQGQFEVLQGCNSYDVVLAILRLGLLVKESGYPVLLADAFVWTSASVFLVSFKALYLQRPQNKCLQFYSKAEPLCFSAYLLFAYFVKHPVNKAGSAQGYRVSTALPRCCHQHKDAAVFIPGSLPAVCRWSGRGQRLRTVTGCQRDMRGVAPGEREQGWSEASLPC